MKTPFVILLPLLFLLTACPQKSPCEKDPSSPECADGTEFITTVIIDFGTAGITNPKWRDMDGAAGNAPTIDTIRLATNQVYQPVKLIVLDESKSPADTISKEILAEKNDHQFFFNSQLSNLVIEYLDKDDNQLPIGLQSKWTTTSTAQGNVQIILKHQPGIKNNNVSTGDTDVDITFPIRVQ